MTADMGTRTEGLGDKAQREGDKLAGARALGWLARFGDLRTAPWTVESCHPAGSSYLTMARRYPAARAPASVQKTSSARVAS